MATPLRMYACLLAIFVMAGAMPGAVALSPDPPLDASNETVEGKGPSCSNAKDDNGVGGSHVSCKYSCGAYAELGLGVLASDRDAATYGNTECGGAAAGCATQVAACAGISPTLTTQAEELASCHGNTDEKWDSPVVVVCFATSGDAQGQLCDFNERLCNVEAEGCLQAASSAGLGWLAEQGSQKLPKSVLSFVIGYAQGDDLASILYDARSGCQLQG